MKRRRRPLPTNNDYTRTVRAGSAMLRCGRCGTAIPATRDPEYHDCEPNFVTDGASMDEKTASFSRHTPTHTRSMHHGFGEQPDPAEPEVEGR